MADLIRKAVASPAGDDPLTFVLSDESVDRAGDVIEVKGWNLANFVKNPIALFGHDHQFVIGHWTDVKAAGGRLIGRLNLLPKGISERLDEIRAAVEAGVLRAVSVGFLPDYTKAEANKSGGYTFRGQELTEASLVAVPMNANALQVAKSLNLSDDAKALIFGETADPEIPQAPEPAVTGKTARVVRLDAPVPDGTAPFVIREIKRRT